MLSIRAVLVLLTIPAVSLAFPRNVAAEWSDVTPAAMSHTGVACGVSWGDFDNDGDQDLYLTNHGQPNNLFRNDGAENFVDVAVGTALADSGLGRSAPWADYDNDEDLDLFLANETSGNRLYRNDQSAGFADVTTDLLREGASVGACWADYDIDGDVDLYVTNYIGGNRLFRNEGGGFSDATTGPLGGFAQSDAASWGDYDNDGDVDLYIAAYDNNALLRNDMGAGFTNVTNGPLSIPGQSEGVAWADYDNDGDLDLYICRQFSTGKLLRNDGSELFSDATGGPLGGPASYAAAWGDYDNDGDLDLYVTPSRLMRNDGSGVFVDVTEEPLGVGGGVGAAWADYDGDGDLDLFMASNTSLNRLFRNELSDGNHWLQVKLLGTVSNRACIGARIRAVTGNTSQIREVSGGSGFCSQNALTVHFGVGAETKIDTLEIRWPSGIVRTMVGVGIDQYLVVVEATAASVADNAGPWPSMVRVTPSPFSGSTRFEFTLGSRSETSVRIYDIQGRLVRTLVSGARTRGPQSAIWDGRNDAGQPLSSGTYFYELRLDGMVKTSGQAVLLR
jgi:hypothetical protein